MPTAPFILPAVPACAVEGGLLAGMLSAWKANGWDPDALASYRMGPDDDDDDSDDAADDDDDSDDGDDADSDDADDDDVARLTRALDNERADHRAAKRALKPWKQLARELNVTPDQVRDAIAKSRKKPAGGGDADDDAPDPEEIRREALRDAQKQSDRKLIRAEIKRLATGLYQDPSDAVHDLDLDDYELDDDGDLDEKQVVRDLKAVIKQKPHRAKHQRRRPRPDRGQGARGSGKANAYEEGLERARKRFGTPEKQDL